MKDLWELYWAYLKIGFINFGGGYAMLPLLERELVNKKGWTTLAELRDYFAIGQCTPGLIALNVSTFIGQKRKGAAGALAAMEEIAAEYGEDEALTHEILFLKSRT